MAPRKNKAAAASIAATTPGLTLLQFGGYNLRPRLTRLQSGTHQAAPTAPIRQRRAIPVSPAMPIRQRLGTPMSPAVPVRQGRAMPLSPAVPVKQRSTIPVSSIHTTSYVNALADPLPISSCRKRCAVPQPAIPVHIRQRHAMHMSPAASIRQRCATPVSPAAPVRQRRAMPVSPAVPVKQRCTIPVSAAESVTSNSRRRSSSIPSSECRSRDTPVRQKSNASADDSVKCAICLDTESRFCAMEYMPCGHGFHAKCSRRWLIRSGACPVCRTPVPSLATPQQAPRWLSASFSPAPSFTIRRTHFIIIDVLGRIHIRD